MSMRGQFTSEPLFSDKKIIKQQSSQEFSVLILLHNNNKEALVLFRNQGSLIKPQLPVVIQGTGEFCCLAGRSVKEGSSHTWALLSEVVAKGNRGAYTQKGCGEGDLPILVVK